MKLQYRALEGTNTKARRLAYLTAIILTLRQESLSEQVLLTKLTKWSQEHQLDLHNYLVQTGEITSTRRNSAGARYVDVAIKLGLITPIAGVYRTTRMGLVLTALLGRHRINTNPFFLNPAERLFYTYHLLKLDADILLTIVGHIAQDVDISLSQLQQTFQNDFLKRLGDKISTCQDETLRQYLRDRQIEVANEWTKPERYAEHIVPPRLNWLLDLGFLEEAKFRQHNYAFTEAGHKFLPTLPCLGDGSFYDVTEQWLDSEYWDTMAKILIDTKALTHWDQVNEEAKRDILKHLLIESFNIFRHTFVPRISLTQAMLYLSIRFLLEYQIVASPSSLSRWLLSPQVVDGRQYEIRLSPRENESYLLMTYKGER